MKLTTIEEKLRKLKLIKKRLKALEKSEASLLNELRPYMTPAKNNAVRSTNMLATSNYVLTTQHKTQTRLISNVRKK